MKNRKRRLSILLIIMLCISPAMAEMAEMVDSPEVDIYDGEIILAEDETDEAVPDEVEIDLDQVEESVDEDIALLDMLDTDLLVMEDESETDETNALDAVHNVVSNDAPSGIKNNGEGGIYIDINSSPYTDFAQKSNGSYAYGTQGCAWFASARLCQVTGIDCIISSGKSWYNERYAWYDLERGTSFPSSGKALVCYDGHVSVIEKVDGDQALISEGGDYYSSDEAHGYCIIHWMDISSVKNRLGGAIGYVYFGRQAVASGKCGDNVYWDLYGDKVLEIHGSGAMWNYSYEEDAPWKRYSNDENDENLIDTVVIGAGITSIGAFAFDSSGAGEFSIADTVTSIGESAFNYCFNLKTITLPDGIERIPDSAFFESAISSIGLPKNLKYIDSYALGRTDSLTSCVFPEKLREIRSEAFFEGGIQSITIPASVELVDNSAFDRCDNLSTIQVSKSNTMYCAKNNVMYTKEMDMVVLCAPKKSGSFDVPQGIRYIGKLAFGGSNLSRITLPEGLKAIGDLAFHGCFNLESINIPSSVATISTSAFLGWSPDGSLLEKLTLYVPYGSYAHKYCRSQDAKHNPDGDIVKYVITKTLSKTGSNGKVTINKGEMLQLIPVKRNGSTIAIKSCKSNSKIAKVNSSGIVTGVSAGETKVTVQPKGTRAMTIKVKVEDPYAPTGIKLNKSGTVKLSLGKTLQLKATVKPSTAETTLTWSSSDNRIAKVSKKGKVTAVKKGTATITVKTSNGKTAKVKIKVIRGSGGGGGGGGY